MQMFIATLFCVYSDYWNSKQKAKQYTENLTSKLHNKSKFYLAESDSEKPGPGATLFRLALIYILFLTQQPTERA